MTSADDLRNLTNRVNEERRNLVESNRAKRITSNIKKAIAEAEEQAGVVASQGDCEVIAYEMIGESLEMMPDDTKEELAGIKAYFEERGFKTRIHGPFTDGGPGRAFTGFDLYICW